MKILHIIFSLPNAGKENILIDIINHQEKCFHKVYLLIINTLIDDNLVKRISNKVIILKINRKPKSKNIFKIFKLNAMLLKISPDIIHSHDIGIIKYIFNSKRFNTFLTVHNTGVANKLLNNYKKIFAISDSVFIENESYLKDSNKNKIVYNGIPTKEIKKRDNFDIGEFINIVQIGRLEIDQKGQDILLTALKLLKNKSSIKFVCDFIGVGPDYYYLSKLVKDYKLSDNVRFIGDKDRTWIYSNLKNYDILVQPSRFEGFGLVVIEAIAANIPIIASDVDGIKDIFNNLYYPIRLKELSPIEISLSIQKIKEYYDTKTIKKYLTNMREKVEVNYDVSRTAQLYLTSYIDELR